MSSDNEIDSKKDQDQKASTGVESDPVTNEKASEDDSAKDASKDASKETRTDQDTEEHSPDDDLPRLKDYCCVNHPDKKAYTVCTRCGKFVCFDCFNPLPFSICRDCFSAEDAVVMRTSHWDNVRFLAEIPGATNHVPRSVKDLPYALKQVVRGRPGFFYIGKEAPYWFSFLFAWLAVAPVTVVTQLVHPPHIDFEKVNPEIVARLGEQTVRQVMENVNGMSVSTLVIVALVSAALQIVLFDTAYFVAIRAIMSDKLTWRECGNTINYCMLPLILGVLAVYFDWALVGMLAIFLMLIKASVAMRVIANCTFWRGTFAMLSFMVLIFAMGLL